MILLCGVPRIKDPDWYLERQLRRAYYDCVAPAWMHDPEVRSSSRITAMIRKVFGGPLFLVYSGAAAGNFLFQQGDILTLTTTGSYTFAFAGAAPLDALIIAGGGDGGLSADEGGGAWHRGGGAGAGGLYEASALDMTAWTGAAIGRGGSNSTTGNHGEASSITGLAITVNGGRRGGLGTASGSSNGTNNTNGSGSGAGGGDSVGSGGTGTNLAGPVYGGNGAAGEGNPGGSAHGGGGGGAGGNASGVTGGAGKTSTLFPGTTYCRGGDASAGTSGTTPGGGGRGSGDEVNGNANGQDGIIKLKAA